MRGPDPGLPTRHAADYRVRFDEATPAGLLRGSALLGYVQDVAWLHSEALGFSRAWYRERGVAWLVRAVEARIIAPIEDGTVVTATTRLTGYRKVLARRKTEVIGPTGELRATVQIDWAMTDGRVPVRIPAEFEQVPIDGPGPFTPIRVDLPPTPSDATLRRFSPRLREIDPMNHANNGVYLDWLDEAIAAAGPAGEAAIVAHPRTYRLAYLRPAEPGIALVSRAWPDGPGWSYRLEAAGGTELLRGTVGPEQEGSPVRSTAVGLPGTLPRRSRTVRERLRASPGATPGPGPDDAQTLDRSTTYLVYAR